MASGSDKAVDGTVEQFNSKLGYFPHWWMIDLGETIPIVKIFLVHTHGIDRLTKMIVTIGMCDWVWCHLIIASFIYLFILLINNGAKLL